MKRMRLFLLVVGALLELGAALSHFKDRIKGNLIAFSDVAFYRQTPAGTSLPIQERLVAHAGGAVGGRTYTNSHDALDEHYAGGYRVFEVDFEWTSDNRLVLVHDWAGTSAAFGVAPHVFSYDEFVKASRKDGLRQMTFEDLANWLQDHRDALVVTDTKQDNLLLLGYLAAHGQDILPQLIIQVYSMSEMQAARRLNPRAVWFTVYKSNYPRWALARVSGIDAIVIPVSLYRRYYDSAHMQKVRYYAHSIPAGSVDKYAGQLPGIYGFYVD